METGLYSLLSRYYDPVTGRFINADDTSVLTSTMNNVTDKNLFAYCDNNPIMREDQGGDRWSWSAFFGGVAITAGVVAVVALTVASGGTAALAIAGVLGTNAAAVSAAAATVGTYACAYGVAAGVGYGITAKGSNFRYATRNNKYNNPNSKGSPKTNQAQNKQFNDVVKKLKLNKSQQRMLHDEITGRGYDYQEILQTAKDMFRR